MLRTPPGGPLTRFALLLLLLACAPEPDRAPFEATIRWTAHGIPHIAATDRPGLA